MLHQRSLFRLAIALLSQCNSHSRMLAFLFHMNTRVLSSQGFSLSSAFCRNLCQKLLCHGPPSQAEL